MDTGTQQAAAARLREGQGYPLDCWWVAATIGEVGTKPLARCLLQQPVVLFRTSDGAPRALTDRCPHRWTPLSLGTIVRDEIICPYHGFRFDGAGTCTHVPTERRPPKALNVRSYPVRDHGPFVWVWMGDPARADPSLLPDISSSGGSAELRIADHRVIECDYAAIHENLADAEHPFYLHRGAFENHRVTLVRHRISGVMEVAPRKISFLSRCDDVPPTNFESLLLGADKNEGIDILMTSIFTVPGCFDVEVKCKRRGPSPGTLDQVRGHYLWISTPISRSSCHFWWILTYDHAHGGHAEIEAIWNKAIQEDIDVLEAIQRSIDWAEAGENVGEMLVASDRPVVALRRLLKKALEAEAAKASEGDTVLNVKP